MAVNRLRLLSLTIWLCLLVGVVAGAVYAFSSSKRVSCREMELRIYGNESHVFLSDTRLERLLRDSLGQLVGQRIDDINLRQVEDLVKRIPSAKEAEAYSLADGRLLVEVWQREPMFRVIDQKGESCYVDEMGYRFPVDPQYSAHVLVVSGKTDLPPEATPLLADSLQNTYWGKMFQLMRYIHHHEIWNSLFGQVYVDGRDRIELVPRVGGQIVLLGSLDHFQYKLDKLWSIYQAALPGDGLNAYSQINLSYGNQVVCVNK